MHTSLIDRNGRARKLLKLPIAPQKANTVKTSHTLEGLDSAALAVAVALPG